MTNFAHDHLRTSRSRVKDFLDELTEMVIIQWVITIPSFFEGEPRTGPSSHMTNFAQDQLRTSRLWAKDLSEDNDIQRGDTPILQEPLCVISFQYHEYVPKN